MDPLQALKRLFAAPSFTPDTLALRESVLVAANQAHAAILALKPADRTAVETSLAPFATSLAGNAFLSAILAGLRHAATGDEAHQIAAITAAVAEDAADVGVGMNTVYHLARLDFVQGLDPTGLAGVWDYEARHRYWLKLVEQAEAVVAGVARKAAFAPNDRVLVLTEQFIAPPHAPSKDALDYARAFQDLGREVMIASTCALGRQLYSPLLPGSRCNLIEGLAGATALAFEGRTFRYHQPASGLFNNATLAESLAAIEAFDPALALVVGGQNLVGELLARRSFVVQYPTFAGLPTTKAFRFFTWRALSEDETATLARLGLADQHLFAHHPGFEPPARTQALTRAQFGIPEDAFVFAVAGMRLGLDVDEAFLDLMRDIRARRPDAHFVFIGEFDGYDERIGALADGASFIGFHSDILSAYALCDAYINPTRKGGGSAIVHALSAGLPALSVAFGDAYEAVRGLPPLADYDALAHAACALAERGETYDAYVRQVAEIAPTLRGKGAVVARLLAAYEAFVSEVGPSLSPLINHVIPDGVADRCGRDDVLF